MPCVGIFVIHFIYTLYPLCIETKRNYINHNKETITLKIFPLDIMSLAMSLHSGSFYKQKRKSTLGLEIYQFDVVKAIP